MNGLVSVEPDAPQPRRPADCPVEEWLAFLGHRWNALVLWHLKAGAKRHGELAELLPKVSPKVLSERLEGLEKRGLIRRLPVATFPRAVRYVLSARGAKLVAILDQIELWSRTPAQVPSGRRLIRKPREFRFVGVYPAHPFRATFSEKLE